MNGVPTILTLFFAFVSITSRADGHLEYTKDFRRESLQREQAPSPRPLLDSHREAAPRSRLVGATASGTVINICYGDDPLILIGCRAVVRMLKACGVNVLSLENPSLADISSQLRGLPPKTNVFVSAHGNNIDSRIVGEKNRHHASVPRGIGTNPETLGFRIWVNGESKPYVVPLGLRNLQKIEISEKVTSNILSTKQILKAIDEALSKDGVYPSKYLGMCHSGEACDENPCTGAACQSDQTSVGFPDSDFAEDQQRGLIYLMCHPTAFARYDTDQNGELHGDELTAYFDKAGLPRQSYHYEGKDYPKPQTMVLKNFKLYSLTPSRTDAAVFQAGVGSAMSLMNFTDMGRANRETQSEDLKKTNFGK